MQSAVDSVVAQVAVRSARRHARAEHAKECSSCPSSSGGGASSAAGGAAVEAHPHSVTAVRKPAGRPHKRRRKGGIDADGGAGSVRCRRCGETGHYATTCITTLPDGRLFASPLGATTTQAVAATDDAAAPPAFLQPAGLLPRRLQADYGHLKGGHA